MKDKLIKIDDNRYRLEKEGNMKVPAEFFLNATLFQNLEEDAINQLKNVAQLPGLYTKALAMPDCHIGYGFPIGGVAAIDPHHGCISPGGIGFDINCGVRMLVTDLTKDGIKEDIHKILDHLYQAVPSGVGSEAKIRLTDQDLDKVLTYGVDFALERGYGIVDDKIFCEELGRMKSADANKVSPRAKARGRKQLGTLGAGNHFLEIQYVEEIFDSDVAKTFGLTKKGQIAIMIHCGSRGLGHQVCSDYLRRMEDTYPNIRDTLPEKDLIYAPSDSKLARDYFAAMSASANFAWANRHIIAHYVRICLEEIYPGVKVQTLYDVAHNIAKEETHLIEGQEKLCWVHRKGATRAFGPGHKVLPDAYAKSGQPIILPGSMGTASYVLAGTKKAEEQTFGSTAHGAGRLMSRFAAKKKFLAKDIQAQLEKDQIFIKSASMKGISEEAPQVYKDVDEVVKVSHESGIGRLIAKVKPFGVIKG